MTCCVEWGAKRKTYSVLTHIHHLSLAIMNVSSCCGQRATIRLRARNVFWVRYVVEAAHELVTICSNFLNINFGLTKVFSILPSVHELKATWRPVT